jgi:hypothetical protein
MADPTNTPTLATLEYITFLDEDGQLPTNLTGKIGVYAIFNRDKILKFIGYSRDIYLSLKQHLVRQPHECYWVKVQITSQSHFTRRYKI